MSTLKPTNMSLVQRLEGHLGKSLNEYEQKALKNILSQLDMNQLSNDAKKAGYVSHAYAGTIPEDAVKHLAKAVSEGGKEAKAASQTDGGDWYFQWTFYNAAAQGAEADKGPAKTPKLIK